MPQQDLNESARRLKELKKEFDDTKQEASRIEGRIQSLEEQLEAQGLANVIKAKKEIRKLKQEVEDIGGELFDRVNQLEEKMP
jgi:predicted  nucleic acid-binding Zn-ribbon protein